MENEKGFIMKEDMGVRCKVSITSKSIKHSKLELAWRISITVAVIALICLSL